MMTRRFLIPVWLGLTACTGFRHVTADVYRAPQSGEDTLSRRIETHGIRTVVCLRGRGDGAATSARASQAAGIDFELVPMSAQRLPRPQTLLHLWRIASTSARPILLHCRAGVDRTGLASALIVLHDTGDLDRARGELSLLYGHVAWTSTGAMDEVLDRYAEHQARLSFPDWVRDIYAAEFAVEAR